MIRSPFLYFGTGVVLGMSWFFPVRFSVVFLTPFGISRSCSFRLTFNQFLKREVSKVVVVFHDVKKVCVEVEGSYKYMLNVSL